jgi:hypothetical protein
METTDPAYPVRFDIDHPAEPRNQLTSASRLILAVPTLVLIAAIGAAGSSSGDPHLVERGVRRPQPPARWLSATGM